MGSDPTQFEVRDGRDFIFGDVQGREFWLLDEADNVRHADELWPSIADKGWRAQSLKAWTFKVPWYRDGKGLMARWRAKHPGEELHYDTASMLDNVPSSSGWRARGLCQERLGVPGEADDPFLRAELNHGQSRPGCGVRFANAVREGRRRAARQRRSRPVPVAAWRPAARGRAV
jgi:hypothetical protein